MERMNSVENKSKRKIYAEKYMEMIGAGFQPTLYFRMKLTSMFIAGERMHDPRLETEHVYAFQVQEVQIFIVLVPSVQQI